MCSHKQSREEGGCEEGVNDSFSFLSETAAGNAKKQQKSHVLPVPAHTRWGKSWVTPARPSARGGSDALDPGPHLKVPGMAARECRVLQHSLPHQSGKVFPALGLQLQRRSEGRYFSLLPVLAASCWSQQLFAWIGKGGMRESISKPELNKPWSYGKPERKGLKLQFLTPL